MTPYFSATVASAGDECLVRCEGEFDITGGDQFRSAVDEALAQMPRQLHIDCAAVSFIDSLGIRALLYTASACAERDVAMTLTASPTMRRLFETVGIAQLLSLSG